MTDEHPPAGEHGRDRGGYHAPASPARGGAVGIALVVGATAGLVAAAALIALVVTALY